eukprot:SAG22_NODE_44_length_24912_cov_33.648894_24_plen_36_part_00
MSANMLIDSREGVVKDDDIGIMIACPSKPDPLLLT